MYLPSLANGFVWDDDLLISRNAHVHTTPLHDIWFLRLWDASGVSMATINPLYADVYRPWITFCYAVSYRVFGPEPFAFHAVNLLVHLATTLLAFLWLAARVRDAPAWLISAAALLFAMHPSKVESVAWISGSTDLWMGFFVLGALYTRERVHGGLRYFLLASCMLLGMFSKETCIALLGWTLTDDYLRSDLRKNLADHIAFVVGIATAGLFRYFAVDSASSLLERIAADWNGLAAVLSSYGHYLRQTFVFFEPAIQPSYLHYEVGRRPLFEAWSLWAGGVFLALTLALALRNLYKPPLLHRIFLAVWLYFLFLLPVSNLITLGTDSLTADRFLYLPLLGLSLLVAELSHVMGRQNFFLRYLKIPAALLVAVVLLLCGIVTVNHIGTFANNHAILKNSLSRDPNNLYALLQLSGDGSDEDERAQLLRGQRQSVKEGRYAMALRFSLRAMRELAAQTADRDDSTLRAIYAAFSGLELKGRLEFIHPTMHLQAQLSAPLRASLSSNVDDFLLPYARVAARIGEFEKAAALLQRARQLAPNDGQIRADMAVILARQGRWSEAKASLDAAEERLPGDDRIAVARMTLERAEALHRALSEMPDHKRELGKVFEPLAVSDLNSAREAYLDLWAARGPTPALLAAALQVEIADGQPSHAYDLLERARSERPEFESEWRALEREISAAESKIEVRKVW